VILKSVLEKEEESAKGSKWGRIVEYLEHVGHYPRIRTCALHKLSKIRNNGTKTGAKTKLLV
jgi:hypothetical protein